MSGLGSRTTAPAEGYFDDLRAAIRKHALTVRPALFLADFAEGMLKERDEALGRCVRAEEALRQIRLLLVDPLPSADALVDELDRLAGVDKPA